jgi:DNA polymerase-3 subunit epsilon/oligoribonuclease
MLGIFLDQETTGLSSQKHRVLELAIRIIDLSSGLEQGRYCSVIAEPQEEWDARDPMSILVNGFTFEEVLRGKPLGQVSREVIELMANMGIRRGQAVFICQNPSFDRPFFGQIVDPYLQERLFWPYHWLDLASMFWALEVKKSALEHSFKLDETALSKDAIAKTLNLPAEAKPHRAMQGVDHLVLCYRHVVGFPLEK